MAELIIQRHAQDKVLDVRPTSVHGGGGATGVGIRLHQQAPPGPGPAPQPRPQPAVAHTAPPAPAPRGTGGSSGSASGGIHRALPNPSPAAPPPPRFDEQELLQTMEEFANPAKKNLGGAGGGGGGGAGGVGGGGGGGGDDYRDDDDYREDDDYRDDDGGDDGQGYDDDDVEDDDDGAQGGTGVGDGETHYAMHGGGTAAAGAAPASAAETPGEGYASIEEEKSDIIFKLQRLQRQGVRGLRQFTPYSDIRDMRTELNRIRTELELERSVKFQRKVLMGIVSVLEWGNTKFNPFDLELDGWSEQMHQSVQSNTEYDGVFEELYFKYRGKVSTPPEIRLMLMVGGSAMMFHMTKAMMKTVMPDLGDVMRQNPAMLQNLFAAAQPASQPHGQPANQAQDQSPGPSQGQGQGGRKEMRGPGFDVSGLAGGLGGLGGGLGGLGGGLGGLSGLGLGMGGMGTRQSEAPGPAARGVPPPPVPSSHLQPMATRPGRLAPPAQRTVIGHQDDVEGVDLSSESERLSDVISEDLESLPDDLDGSINGDDDGASSARGVKRVRLPLGLAKRSGGGGGAKRPRKGAGGGAPAKKVITIA
jgi:hypothetical protein